MMTSAMTSESSPNAIRFIRFERAASSPASQQGEGNGECGRGAGGAVPLGRAQ
jgi:hypothetical protein